MLTIILGLLMVQMPAGMSHEEHLKQMAKEDAMKKRGVVAMGFDQDTTVHHFRLEPDGGAIEVDVKNTADATSRAAIRSHLKEITLQFGRGDFSKPLLTHAENPPGATRMAQLRSAIAYQYEDTTDGGRVRIRSSNADAVRAVHDFLRYQIREHHTRDVTPAPK
jgi:Fe2+ transport system protein FeoA